MFTWHNWRFCTRCRRAVDEVDATGLCATCLSDPGRPLVLDIVELPAPEPMPALDPTVVSCCPLAVTVDRFEFVVRTNCAEHGARERGTCE